MFEIERPVAWITGASSGIGRACAVQLAREGYHVAISSRSLDRLQSTREEIEHFSSAVTAVQCDVRDEVDVIRAHDEISGEAGGISVLINNAGISPFTTFSDTTHVEFREVIDTNVIGMFHCAKAVLPGMYGRKQGTIVQMLSIASRKAFRGGAAYAASKFAALGFTDCLREEARKYGVKVIAVMPGATETEAWDDSSREEFRKRMMQPEDIAHAIARVLTEPQRMMTEELVLRPIGGDL
jgi:3-oxoacyl-[acyl-carrier protein] reductase